jgi:cellulose synthase/poly-beta-1,6-N-acetylglucosamine synthase-like glycosyltransferase
MDRILYWMDFALLVYLAILHLFTSISLVISSVIVPRRQKRYWFSKGVVIDDEIKKPISVIVPAYNEEKVIIDSVNSFLSLDYLHYEIVVVNDGSTDKTLEILIKTFDFVPVDVEPNSVCESKTIHGIYYSKQNPKLVLVDKENGGKADAQNAGTRVARHPYISIVDADTLLDKESFDEISIRLTVESDIVAIGGIIRVANGCRIEDGQVTEVGMPRRLIERFQVIEYLRSFLFGRVSLTSMGALVIISGAFGVYRGDAVAMLKGWKRDAIGEDVDAVVRLRRMIYEKGLGWKVDFLPTPISWTQVPMSWKSLGHQRERWQRGLMQVLTENKKMLLNPRYGSVGMIGFPYLVFYEMISAFIEAIALPYTLILFAFGYLNTTFMVDFLALVTVWGLCISFFTIQLQESMRFRYGKTRDLLRLLMTAVFENIGFRQIHSFWRLKGMMKYIFKKSARSSGMKNWTSIERSGFSDGEPK